MRENTTRRKFLEPSIVRTDRDPVMIFVGVALILLFLVSGYISLTQSDRQPAANKIRGPVKNPNPSSSLFQIPQGLGNPRTQSVFACRFTEHFTLPLVRHKYSECGESPRKPAGLVSSILSQQNLPQYWNLELVRRAYRDFHAVT